MPRTKPHAKIHVTMKHHRKTTEIWADNDMLALYVRLLTLGIERFAARTGDTFTIHEREVAAVTGRKRRDYGELALTKLAASSPLCATKLGASWQITIPNFAKKQGFRTKNGTGKSAPEVLRAEVLSTEVTPPIKPPPTKPAKPKLTAFPADPAPLIAALSVWAEKHPEHGNLNLSECVATVEDWAIANGKRKHDWLRCVQAGIRSGWARVNTGPKGNGPKGNGRPKGWDNQRPGETSQEHGKRILDDIDAKARDRDYEIH